MLHGRNQFDSRTGRLRVQRLLDKWKGRLTMYRIGICDDRKEICRHVNQMVQAYEVEAFFIRGRELDLLFLDIGLKGMSGIELGKKIREE